EGTAPMADPLLVLFRRLTEGLLQLLRHEVRVVAESAEAARLRDYHAGGGPGSHDCTLAVHVGCSTDERRRRRQRVHTTELPQQRRIVRGVERFAGEIRPSRVALAAHAWAPSQHVDRKSGVVGEGGEAGASVEILRLCER